MHCIEASLIFLLELCYNQKQNRDALTIAFAVCMYNLWRIASNWYTKIRTQAAYDPLSYICITTATDDVGEPIVEFSGLCDRFRR